MGQDQDQARQHIKKSRAAGKKMNQSGARVVQSLRETARVLRTSVARTPKA